MVTIPPIIGDIVASLLPVSATLHVIARFEDRTEVTDRLVALRPDLVMIGLQNGETDEIARVLLSLMRGAKVVAFSNDGRSAYVHEMRAHRKALVDVSPRALINAILRK